MLLELAVLIILSSILGRVMPQNISLLPDFGTLWKTAAAALGVAAILEVWFVRRRRLALYDRLVGFYIWLDRFEVRDYPRAAAQLFASWITPITGRKIRSPRFVGSAVAISWILTTVAFWIGALASGEYSFGDGFSWHDFAPHAAIYIPNFFTDFLTLAATILAVRLILWTSRVMHLPILAMNLVVAIGLAGLGLGAAMWSLDTAIERRVVGTAGHQTLMQQIEAEACVHERRIYAGIRPKRLTFREHLRLGMLQTLQAVQLQMPAATIRWECEWQGRVWNRGFTITRNPLGMFSYAASSLIPAAMLTGVFILLVLLRPCTALMRWIVMRYIEEATTEVPAGPNVRFTPLLVLVQGLCLLALVVWCIAQVLVSLTLRV